MTNSPLLTLTFISASIMVMIPQVHAQSVSPLTLDQDGDGDPLNEEYDIRGDCYYDHVVLRNLEGIRPTLNGDDCNFVMHYLSGQCEEQTAMGVNVTQVCDTFLKRYLSIHGLLTNDFPTDTERFNAVLDRFKQNEAKEQEVKEQEKANREANTPSWTEGLE